MEGAEGARVCRDAARLLSQALAQEKVAERRKQLAGGLMAVAGGMEPAEAFRLLSEALARKESADARGHLAFELLRVANRMEATPGVCAETARMLSKALGEAKDASERYPLAETLAQVAEGMEPGEAARLVQVHVQDKDPWVSVPLATCLAGVAGRMEPGEAVRLLNEALAQTKEGQNTIQMWSVLPRSVRGELAGGLTTVAERLGRVKGTRLLKEALAREKEPVARWTLARALLAGRLAPGEAAHVWAAVTGEDLQVMDQGADKHARRDSANRVAMLLQVMEGERADRAAGVLARRIVSKPNLRALGDELLLEDNRSLHPHALEGFLTKVPRRQVRQQAVAITSAIGMSASGPALSLAFLQAAGEALPCRLGTQDLVELLKMPTCVGEVRRVILDQLGNRYRRHFEMHWDFVRYAQERGLELDFSTPAKRPERRLPALIVE
jgi:hypothetical protein